MKKAFQDMLHELGEVNPTHAYYNGSCTSKDTEDPSWSTSFKTRRTERLFSFGRLWKTYLSCIVLIGNIFPEVKGWLDEDLEYYHLKELHYSAQCHTQMSLWIISRGVVLLILLMEYKFQVWYIELTSPSDHSNSRKNTRLKIVQATINVSESAQDRDVGLGGSKFKTSTKGSMKKAFQDMLHGLGGS
ncbi:hypothetical protein Tco_1477172 [Tanacetum coccineum]